MTYENEGLLTQEQHQLVPVSNETETYKDSSNSIPTLNTFRQPNSNRDQVDATAAYTPAYYYPE